MFEDDDGFLWTTASPEEVERVLRAMDDVPDEMEIGPAYDRGKVEDCAAAMADQTAEAAKQAQAMMRQGAGADEAALMALGNIVQGMQAMAQRYQQLQQGFNQISQQAADVRGRMRDSERHLPFQMDRLR